MTSGDTEAFATRLTAEEASYVNEAIEQTGLSQSDFVARSVRYYLIENPDNIPALQADELKIGPLEKAGILPPELETIWAPSFEL
jgi:hypothetical protein